MREKKSQCICKICGKQFLGVSKNAKFCSLRCVYDDQNAKRKSKIKDCFNTCQICGKVFKTRKPNENTCSPECKKIRKSKQDKESRLRHINERKIKEKERRENKKDYMRDYKFFVYNNFCKKGEEEQIENYTEAKAENFKNWTRHHRLETHNSDGEKRIVFITVKELKALNMYYDRPAKELIWLRKEEHSKLHNAGVNYGKRNI